MFIYNVFENRGNDMSRIIIVRHGQTKHNADGIYFGKLNPELNEVGLAQAKEAREKILNINYDNIYASPLYRAYQTAQIVNYAEKEIICDKRIEEIDFGILEGLTFSEIQEQYPHVYKNMEENWLDYNYESGESPQEMYNRTVEFLKDLDYSKDNLIVSHWGPINCILSYFLANNMDLYWKFKVKNGTVIILEGDKDFMCLKKFF